MGDKTGYTAMHHACANTKKDDRDLALEVLKELLEGGGNVNSCSNDNEQTPLHSAVGADNVDALYMLLKLASKKGLALKNTNKEGATAQDMAEMKEGKCYQLFSHEPVKVFTDKGDGDFEEITVVWKQEDEFEDP